MAKVFDINTPRLSNLRLRLINDTDSNAINVIAPQLESLTIIDCSIKDLNIQSGFSSFYYKGYDPPQWFKKCFHSVNKVTISLSIYFSNQPYMQEEARGIINLLQDLRSVRFLTLNVDIVECISSFPELVSGQPSPFSNLISLKVDCGTRDTCKVNISTEARKFLLEKSPTATFTVKEQHTEAMKEKEVKEQIKADIEDLLRKLKALLEQDSIITEKKVVIENLLNDIQKIWTKKKETQIESSERVQIEEIVSRLRDIVDMLMQLVNDLEPLISKTMQIRCLLCILPKRHREHMVAYYRQHGQVVAQATALITRQASLKDFVYKMMDALEPLIARQVEQVEALSALQASKTKIIGAFRSSISQVVSSTRHPLPSQTSSSSTIVPTPSTSTQVSTTQCHEL
ncbi:uncharacterized protein [Rutidosis leptorrhynchoides]|uniref:uncharacterized protein isoform X1 n=1 Tax=Rutidosis leptorrhynchoides TaxID=125765 RepID=UPI003A98CEA5